MNAKPQMSACLTLALLLAVGGIDTAFAQLGNTAYGTNALTSNTTGSYNSAFGGYTLSTNSVGTKNTASGSGALQKNFGGSINTATGYNALSANSGGNGNTASGAWALNSNTIGSYNVANGVNTLRFNTTGRLNTATGYSALYRNTTGEANSVVGSNALFSNTKGKENTVNGASAMYLNTTGSRNSAFGPGALQSNTTGWNNIGVGYLAGYTAATGSNSIFIGSTGTPEDDAVIRVGTPGTQQATYIAGVSGVNVTGGVPVMVTATGQLGVVSSSRRYKQDIRSMGDASDRLLKLHPVTFRYKQLDEKGQKPEQYGLIAEEVAQVMPELVVYNDKGQPETVAYQALAPLLVNELQREHKRVLAEAQQLATQSQELASMKAQIAELRRLTAQLAAARSLDDGRAEQAAQVTMRQ